MKHLLMIAGLFFGLALMPALAEEPSGPKGPPKTMGDEGTLPVTETMKDAKPDMVGSDPKKEGGTTTSGSEEGAHTMGDKGKLPATGATSGKVNE
jgi:hypothetical protein